MSGKETVLEKYYALIHTVAHLTLLCSGSGATPWLSDMAKSFTWTNWTPTFPLVRERTVWLAAAAARSAIAFGAEVVDRYAGALVRHSALRHSFRTHRHCPLR
jgi:ferredoxin-NADP reductase